MILRIIITSLLLTKLGLAQWIQTNGPLGGDIRSLMVKADTFFIGTQSGGAYRSLDKGDSWEIINTGLNSVYHLAGIKEKNFAAAIGIYRSTDNGGEWEDISNGLSGVYFIAAIDTTLFATSSSTGFYRSDDMGNSFQPVTNGLTNNKINSLVKLDTLLFGSTYGDGVYRSSDGGNSWAAINNGLSNLFVQELLVRDTVLFAGTFGGAFRSYDQGNSWSIINTGLTNVRISSLALWEPNILAATSAGIYKSGDEGDNWELVTGSPHNLRGFGASGNVLLIGNQEGMYRYKDTIVILDTINNGLIATPIYSLTNLGSNLFSGSDGGGMYKSTDNGDVWNSAQTGVISRRVFGFAGGDTSFYAGTNLGVLRSNDSGVSWRSTGLGNIAWSITKNGNNIFSGYNDGDIIRSIDNGLTWTNHNIGLTTNRVIGLTMADSILYAGTSQGVFLSRDKGDSWEADTNLNNASISSFVFDGNSLFAAGNSGIYRSLDTGKTWVHINTGFGLYGTYSIKKFNNILFAGTYADVYRSVDNGDNWEKFDSGLPIKTIESLTTLGDYLYAGVLGGGVWKNRLSPLPVQLVAPMEADTISQDSLIVNWNSNTNGVTEYELELSYIPQFLSGIITFNPSDTSQMLRSLENDSTYFWRVRAKNSWDWGPYSEIRSFIVNIPPTSVPKTEKNELSSLKLLENGSLQFRLSNALQVQIVVHDTQGKEISKIVDSYFRTGLHKINMPRKLSQGVYLISISTNHFTQSRLMYLLR